MVERSSRSRPTTFKTKLPRCFSLGRQERRESMDRHHELALRLKKWRKENGITQTRLAELLGISRSYVCFIETGRCHPSARLIPVITSILESERCSGSKRQELDGFTAEGRKKNTKPSSAAVVAVLGDRCLKQSQVQVTDEQWRDLRGRLKNWCEQNSAKQFQMAQILGISSGHISHIATGKDRPSRALFEKILAMLDSSNIKSAKSCTCKTHSQTVRRPRHAIRIGLAAATQAIQFENEDKKNFWGGDQVRQLRRLNGLTQKGLAELLGVGRLYVSKIENGVRALSYNTAKKIVELSESGAIRLPGNQLFEIFVDEKEDGGLQGAGRDTKHPFRAFGEKVRSVRSSSGKTVGEFAQDLQISVFALRLIEEGWNDASGEVLLRLWDVFGADVNWLLGIEGSDPTVSSDKTSKDSRSQLEKGNA